MKAFVIDKNPPTLTGDSKKDLKNLVEYESYLREQLNRFFSLVQKELSDGE